jgi:hypothetical protein
MMRNMNATVHEDVERCGKFREIKATIETRDRHGGESNRLVER